jgi:hypothetical protein
MGQAKPTPSLSHTDLAKFVDEHLARRRAIKEAVATKHRNRIALATEPYSPYNTVNS